MFRLSQPFWKYNHRLWGWIMCWGNSLCESDKEGDQSNGGGGRRNNKYNLRYTRWYTRWYTSDSIHSPQTYLSIWLHHSQAESSCRVSAPFSPPLFSHILPVFASIIPDPPFHNHHSVGLRMIQSQSMSIGPQLEAWERKSPIFWWGQVLKWSQPVVFISGEGEGGVGWSG